MYIYTAAVFSNSYMPGMNRYVKLTERERQIVEELPHILESWHYVGKQGTVDHMRANKAQIFLDSGAFSAWTLGATMDITAYCDYIRRNQDILRFEGKDVMASVLDGIGDPQQTWENQLYMEHLLRPDGLRPLPCFHFGEDERYLEHYVANYDYITIGGMVGKSAEQLKRWLDRIWEKYMIEKGTGSPKLKVHGFGITTISIMEAYPWWSCDSSSWIQAAAFGSIVMPGVSRKAPALALKVSDKSPSRHTTGQHVSTLSAIECQQVYDELERQGFTYERLSTVYESRAAYNLWAFGVINGLINASGESKFRSGFRELF